MLTPAVLVSMSMKSQSGKSNSLGMLIFVAILAHKIPASIGLGSFLISCPSANHFWHLIAFTITSPAVTVVMFVALMVYENTSAAHLGQKAMSLFVGCILLFSAGTFLYVALLHILPEALKDQQQQEDDEDQVESSSQSACSIVTEFIVITCGMAVPYVLHELA